MNALAGSIPADARVKIEEFRKRTGRNPAVLHIGNIANNAYINSRLLREAGIDCDVCAYDYYHIMGSPEWEDADFANDPGDQYSPDWAGVDLRGFVRPSWFAQGPARVCIRYLAAKRDGRRFSAWLWWSALEMSRPRPFRRSLRVRLARGEGLFRKVAQFWCGIAMLVGCFLAIFVGRYWTRIRRRFVRDPVSARADALVAEFAEAFPERPDKLNKRDFDVWLSLVPLWTQLFRRYDIVQGYATDPILPMLAAKHPYLGFEHGTLRAFTQGDDPVHRLTSLAYRQADLVFITNGDCLDYARRIGVTRFCAMLHPVDERRIREMKGDPAAMRAQYGAARIFLCTLRHDWVIKGTDRYIRALPALRERIGPDFKVLMTMWGQQVDESKALARSLGVDGNIAWIEPLSRTALYRVMKSVDVVFDQLALPHFGATAPESIAAEIPVISSYDPASTAWLVGAPAPILPAFDEAGIVDAVVKACDPVWRQEYAARARAWIDEHHTVRRVVATHASVYSDLLFSQEKPDGV